MTKAFPCVTRRDASTAPTAPIRAHACHGPVRTDSTAPPALSATTAANAFPRPTPARAPAARPRIAEPARPAAQITFATPETAAVGSVAQPVTRAGSWPGSHNV